MCVDSACLFGGIALPSEAQHLPDAFAKAQLFDDRFHRFQHLRQECAPVSVRALSHERQWGVHGTAVE